MGYNMTRLNKKILLPLSLIALSSTSLLASNQTFQATVTGWSEPTFAETQALHFGKIRLANGSSCTMSSAGAVTGDCDASDANIKLGKITVSGLAPTSAMNITVTGAAGTNVTFTSSSSATDGTTTVAVPDNTVTAFTTDGSGTDIVIDVFGTMAVTSALTANTAYTADYTVDVSFQ